MDRNLETLNRHISTLEYAFKQMRQSLDEALKERKSYLEARHTYTAADYRIVLIQDEMYYEFDDIMGDAPQTEDSDSFKERYQAMYDAYHNEARGGIYALLVSTQKRDVETGEFEELECCGGLFHLGSDSQKRIFDEAREIAHDFLELPEGITMADINVFAEEDVK